MVSGHDIPDEVREKIDATYAFLARVKIDILSFQDIAAILVQCGYRPQDFKEFSVEDALNDQLGTRDKPEL